MLDRVISGVKRAFWFFVDTIKSIGRFIAKKLVSFWEKIRTWLDNTAADFVERELGYPARDKLHRATTTIDRGVDVIRNFTVVYLKDNDLDTTYDKVTMEAKADYYTIDDEILEEIKKNKKLVRTLEYRK